MTKVNTKIDSKVNELYAKTYVTQTFSNSTEESLELKIFVFKRENIIFSSFNCQIGDSIKVKSKVIKKEKAEIKYTDTIASGNTAIFVTEDQDFEQRIIINMGNIPSKTKVIFISEFIHPIEASNKYEFELFRNIPTFQGNDRTIYENYDINGVINIKTKNEIINIEKNILMKDLKIIEEGFQDEKNDYMIKYQIEKLPDFSNYNLEYIPSSKIYFDLKMNEPFAYAQQSLINSNENNYFIQYRYKDKNNNNKKEIANSALFIFLIDQSNSMSGTQIKIASKALQLFIRSLPAGSYYQIIGFGTDFRKYDEIPKEYNKENVNKTLKVIEKLKADLGGTNISGPLKEIYNHPEIYDKINLPRNIFLLTDGEIWDKQEALSFIEQNSNKYSIYSIGIGNSFDPDLIKNAGIIGKGNYNFCRDLNNLNSIIASEINKATSNYISNVKINTSLNDKNIIKNNSIPNILRPNNIVNLYYVTEKKDESNQKLKIEINYLENGQTTMVNNYEITPVIIEKGEDLTKLIINNYLLENKNLSNKEKLELSLKYQIFSKYTSLFTEFELSEKIIEEMKLKIIGDKKNNLITELKPNNSNDKILDERAPILGAYYDNEYNYENNRYSYEGENDFEDGRNYSEEEVFEEPNKSDFNFCGSSYNNNEGILNSCKNQCSNNDNSEKEDGPKKTIIELNEKESIMDMINTQDLIGGYWDENEYTKIIKNKYQNEYYLLKGLKNKNINDRIAITILIIYYINKEHPELLVELLMIIKKAKIFIQNNIKDTYENTIKEVNLN